VVSLADLAPTEDIELDAVLELQADQRQSG
jgi:hypothetical protein